MQAQALPRRTPYISHRLQHHILPSTNHTKPNPTPLEKVITTNQLASTNLANYTTTTKPSPTHHPNNIAIEALPSNNPLKHGLILDQRQLIARNALARRRATYKERIHHTTKQQPLSNYWPDISPQSLPVALHPTNPTKKLRSHSIHRKKGRNPLQEGI
jgi:hypothetical protein